MYIEKLERFQLYNTSSYIICQLFHTKHHQRIYYDCDGGDAKDYWVRCNKCSGERNKRLSLSKLKKSKLLWGCLKI